MGERRALVIASQCESLNLLSFLPEAARDVADALLDPEVGGCVPALADGRRLLVDPTMVQLDDAVTAAFERASEDEATLFIALVGHGDYAGDDFYFLTRDTTDPANSRNAFHLAQRIKELLGRYSMLDGLVILLDTCHAGIAAQQAAHRWIKIVGEAGKRFEVLTASDDRTAADGCFSRSLAKTLRDGRSELGERMCSPDLKRVVSGLCPAQTAVHLAFDGVRTVGTGDQGLWLARNNAEAWRPLRGHPSAAEIERLTRYYKPPKGLGAVVARLLTDRAWVQLVGGSAADRSSLLAALARPSVAERQIPPKLLHASLFLRGGQTNEQVAEELARQLATSIPAFAEAGLRYADEHRADDDAFGRAVLGPLALLPPDESDPIRIAIDGIAELPRAERVTLTKSLNTDRWTAAGTQLVVSGEVLSRPAYVVVNLDRAGTSWMDEEQLRTRSVRVRRWHTGDEPDAPGPGEILAQILATAFGFLPISMLVAASGLAGGPSRGPAVRDDLARMSYDVTRADPGTPAERVRYLGEAVDAPPRWHRILVDAIKEVAPVDERKNGTPEQAYATANEAEHLWQAGLHEDALESLQARLSDVPVENRERWSTWAKRVTAELGAAHPLALRCEARRATWVGKAGDPVRALALFEDLLPHATAVLGAADVEVLSIRNNLGFLLMELERFAEARAAFGALAEDAAAALGADDRETIHARHLFAIAAGKCGDGEESLRLSQELLPDAERALGEEADIVEHIQHNLVFWGNETEHPRYLLRSS